MKVIWLAIATSVLWGLAPAFDKMGLVKATPLAALAVRTLVVGIGVSTFVLVSGGWREFATLDSRSVLYIVLGSLAAGLVGQFVYFHALKLGQATRVVPIAATYPLVAAIVAVVLVKETLTPGKIVGLVLIVLGVVAIRLDQLFWPK